MIHCKKKLNNDKDGSRLMVKSVWALFDNNLAFELLGGIREATILKLFTET
jgi:hypothetical protein